jgi:hypothetical protein
VMPAGVTTVVATGQGFLPEAPVPKPTMTPAELQRPGATTDMTEEGCPSDLGARR